MQKNTSIFYVGITGTRWLQLSTRLKKAAIRSCVRLTFFIILIKDYKDCPCTNVNRLVFHNTSRNMF